MRTFIDDLVGVINHKSRQLKMNNITPEFLIIDTGTFKDLRKDLSEICTFVNDKVDSSKFLGLIIAEVDTETTIIEVR